MELIDRQSALSVCKKYGWIDDEDFIDGYNTAIKDIREAIKELPTVEAEQLTIEAKTTQHAKWVGDTFCSSCNRFPVYQGMHISNQELANYFSYCPHCGAKIIKENNND